MISVIIDNREKGEHVTKLKTALREANIPAETRKLSVGDYLLEDENGPVAIIEHKTYQDFVASIQNRHLESQLCSMDKSDIPQYLFINGTYAQFRNSPSFKYFKIGLQGVYTYKVTYNHKARIVEFDTEGQLINGVIALAKHLKNKTPTTYGVIPERVRQSGVPSIDMFMAIDGIGYKTSEKLVEKGITLGYLYALVHSVEPEVAKILIKEQYGITIKESSLKWLKEVA